MSSDCVAEITGPYGTVHIAEKVIQRLWATGTFLNLPMRTTCGKTVRIESVGRANGHEGPDFLEASWSLDGERTAGDIEIHFYREDWLAHGHAYDPNFRDVGLHVLVFPPETGSAPVRTVSGRALTTLVLLPHLPADLEHVATEDALMRAEKRPDERSPFMLLAGLPAEAREHRIHLAAMSRWESKVAFVRRRMEKAPPEIILHRLMLETLGLRRNRALMAELAERHGPEDFANRAPEALFETLRGRWILAGVRPANHPLARIAAYAKLVLARPDPGAALGRLLARPLPEDTGGTAAYRRAVALSRLRSRIAGDVLAGTVGGSRLDTLVVDALLPWLASREDRNLFSLWRHWSLGDAPDRTAKTLGALGLSGPGRPVSNGLFQGLAGIACTGLPGRDRGPDGDFRNPESPWRPG